MKRLLFRFHQKQVKQVQVSHLSIAMDKSDVLSSSRSSARDPVTSARVKSTPRDDSKTPSARSSTSEIAIGSGRSAKPEGSVGAETFRTSMDTARVHTALAALSAEKQALLAKLNMIDSALENDGRKKATAPRFIPKPTKTTSASHK